MARAAKDVAQAIANASTEDKNRILNDAAAALEARASDIMAANERDISAGREAGLSEALIDRLALTPERVKGIADGLRQVASLPDPVGDIVAGRTLANGLRIRQVRVPLGVMGMVYEARPNVTVDAFGLALKSGNVALLRGSQSAWHSNKQLVEILQETLAEHGFPREVVQLLPCETRESVQDLITARGLVDVVIPRGGAGLIAAVVENATVPTIETGSGNCHLYVDGEADVNEAIALAVNGKTRRPSVCNATETVLIDAALPAEARQRIVSALQEAGVTVHGLPEELGEGVVPADESDWHAEYLSMDIAVKLVDGVEGAIAHIAEFSSGHTEAIATRSLAAAEKFTAEVDAAAVVVNASTAFTDGEQFGFGAEIGISTQKLHARGPMALPELTSTKWIVFGDGHTRP